MDTRYFHNVWFQNFKLLLLLFRIKTIIGKIVIEPNIYESKIGYYQTKN